VVCIDRNAIGEHTKIEMNYAERIGKLVLFADEVLKE
jgi:hypothetical protein